MSEYTVSKAVRPSGRFRSSRVVLRDPLSAPFARHIQAYELKSGDDFADQTLFVAVFAASTERVSLTTVASWDVAAGLSSVTLAALDSGAAHGPVPEMAAAMQMIQDAEISEWSTCTVFIDDLEHPFHLHQLTDLIWIAGALVDSDVVALVAIGNIDHDDLHFVSQQLERVQLPKPESRDST